MCPPRTYVYDGENMLGEVDASERYRATRKAAEQMNPWRSCGPL
jgi:hypothetical protein